MSSFLWLFIAIGCFTLSVGRILTNYDYYKPTDEELERALVVQPPSYWGEPFYLENKSPSIRILVLGGSNSANDDNYVPILHTMLQEWMPDKNSLVYSGAISGHGPTRMRHAFEGLDTSKWPNVVILEFAVNFDGLESIKALDQLVGFMNQKYTAKELPIPSYLVFELFRVSSFYNWKETFHDPTCNETVIEHNPNITNLQPPEGIHPGDFGFNHGSKDGMYLSMFARFYRIPLISVVDALWPSFVRYYDTHLTCSQWPFTRDGVHLSPFGANYNFFARMLARPEPIAHSLEARKTLFADLQARLFDPSLYRLPESIAEFHTWGVNVPDTLNYIIVPKLTTGFALQRFPHHEHDDHHLCYGSVEPEAVLTLALGVPASYFKHHRTEHRVLVQVQLGLVFSWNASLVGDLTCTTHLLNTTHYDDPNQPMELQTLQGTTPLIIHTNPHTVRDTTPHTVTLTSPLVFPIPQLDSMYALQCKKLDSRLTCFASLSLIDITTTAATTTRRN